MSSHALRYLRDKLRELALLWKLRGDPIAKQFAIELETVLDNTPTREDDDNGPA